MSDGEIKNLDCRNLVCPIPLVTLSKIAKDIPKGEMIKVLGDDPAFEKNIFFWCKMLNHKIIKLDKEGTLITFIIQLTGKKK